MRFWQVVTAVVASSCVVVAACSIEEPAGDETYDFAESTTTELRGSTPYDTYVLLVDRSGIEYLGYAEAEQRAQALCLDPDSAADSGDDGVTDAALLRAYCPEVGEPG